MNAPEIWYTGYGLNLVVTVFTGSILAAFAMLVCIVGLVYSEKTS